MEDKDGRLIWRKARASSSNGGCVEVAADSAATLVRDTKSRERGHITVSHQSWATFVGRIKAGEFQQ
jgi:hypothetical protein